jgi:hypothetical protein
MGQHHVPNQSYGTLSYYEDPAHGIEKMQAVCDECLLQHVRQWYPNSPIERAIVNLRPELALDTDG